MTRFTNEVSVSFWDAVGHARLRSVKGDGVQPASEGKDAQKEKRSPETVSGRAYVESMSVPTHLPPEATHSALLVAVEQGQMELVAEIVKAGVDVAANSNEALRLACSCVPHSNTLAMVKLLLELGADARQVFLQQGAPAVTDNKMVHMLLQYWHQSSSHPPMTPVRTC